MDELTREEGEAFDKLSKQSIDMENQKAKTMGSLEARGLISTQDGTKAWKTISWRIAASVVLFGAGYVLGNWGILIPQPDHAQGKYALFLYENNEFTVADGQDLVKEYSGWARDLAAQNKLVYAEKLNDNEKQWLGKETVQNSTSKLTGYFVFYASSMEEARKIADTHPHTRYGGGLELRPIDEVR